MSSASKKKPPPICRRCGHPVVKFRNDYDLFEQMHWICFHYEFEHLDLGGQEDPDEECDDPSCPIGRLRRYEEKLRSLGIDPVDVSTEEHLRALGIDPTVDAADSNGGGASSPSES